MNTIKNYEPQNIEQLRQFLTGYTEIYPDVTLAPAELYTYHPALEQGKNAFCVVNEEEHVIGFAPLFPAPVDVETAPGDPHQFWTVMLVDPTSTPADPAIQDDVPIRELLLHHVLQRAQEIAQTFPPHPVRVSADYKISQKTEIDFLLKQGFTRYEGMFLMQREVTELSPELPLPDGITVRPWKLASETEQQQYLAAHNRCFPAHPKSLESLKFLLDSPWWSNGGTTFAAFDQQQQVIANVMVYKDPEQPYATTDDVFVLPEWRGKGLAKHLLQAGLKHLQQQGFSEVRLDVLQSNRPAVGLYQAMGYSIINEDVFVGRFLDMGGNEQP